MRSIVPVGVIIDLDTCFDTTYRENPARQAKIIGIMGFNTETLALEPMDKGEIDRSNELASCIGKNIMYYFTNNNIYLICSLNANGSTANAIGSPKIFDNQGNLFRSEHNDVSLICFGSFRVKINLVTFEYSITFGTDLRTALHGGSVVKENVVSSYLDSVFNLFTKIGTGMYTQDKLLMLRKGCAEHSIIMPKDSVSIVFCGCNGKSIENIVFSEKFADFLFYIDTPTLSSVKSIALSKNTTVEQLISILNTLNSARGNCIRDLNSIIKYEGCEYAYDFLYKNEEAVKELMDGIEVTVY